MNTPFEKIYVCTLPAFHSRMIATAKQLKELDIKFNFVFGTDFGNIKSNHQGYKMFYPDLFEYDQLCDGRSFSCTITHYQAVYQAYELGYNNVLIMEDDICFKKDKKLVETYLNNIPEDADFVTYDPRFLDQNKQSINNFNNDVKNCKELYIKDNGQYDYMFGGMLYALMNRKTMELYLENQRKGLIMNDHVQGLFMNVTVNKYIAAKCICIDQYNLINNFKTTVNGYKNFYKNNENLLSSDFYAPNEYHLSGRL